jgi:DNA-binding transcriptional ArsR family regulator
MHVDCEYWVRFLRDSRVELLTIAKRLYNLLAMLDLNTAFSALSDPTRREILARLALGEHTVMELAQPFDMSQPAISKHLRVLESAGLIARRVEGAKRPCRLAKGGVEAIDQWLAMLRKALAGNYDRLDALLADSKPPKTRTKR